MDDRNAGSLPPRLPYLSPILRSVQEAPDIVGAGIRYSIIALSYRGFWKSQGHPSQAGIELDAQASLEWLARNFDMKSTQVVLWGQSIGAGIATTALASLIRDQKHPDLLRAIRGLILETPFTDLRSMLVALYPQRYLPYRYLWPFLRSMWDSRVALESIAAGKLDHTRTLILQAGEDDIVPEDQAGILESICKAGNMDVRAETVAGSSHNEVMIKDQGRMLIATFLKQVGATQQA